jgi:hypothetical protein
MVFNFTFNNNSVISWKSVLLVEETGVDRENHQPAASHWQTLSQNIELSTPLLSKIRTHTVSSERHRSGLIRAVLLHKLFDYTYLLKNTSMYFPNLLELSLRIVLAFPNDSNNGFASRICSVIRLLPFLLTAARYCITNFVASVLPAPLSPLKKYRNDLKNHNHIFCITWM